MAKRTIELLTDDIDGTELGDGEGQTLSFAVGSATYEIDLSQQNVDKFYDVLTPYMEHGRKLSGRSRSAATAPSAAPAGRSSARTDKDQLSAIREWAKQRGMKVSDRGRISKEVQQAYNASL